MGLPLASVSMTQEYAPWSMIGTTNGIGYSIYHRVTGFSVIYEDSKWAFAHRVVQTCNWLEQNL